MPRLEPKASELTQPFWEATRDKQLMVQWCQKCDAGIYYPRWACPSCLGDELAWRAASGKATLYTFNVGSAAANPMMADMAPYSVALVDLDEGVRMVSTVVGCDPDDLKVGMALQVDWEPLSDGRHLPVWRPVS
jgi:uncharacterized OB-fold protein